MLLKYLIIYFSIKPFGMPFKRPGGFLDFICNQAKYIVNFYIIKIEKIGTL